MKNTTLIFGGLLLATCGLLTACKEAPPPANSPRAALPVSDADAARIAALRAQLASLQQQTQQVKDTNAIKRLQRAYGYYVEEALWDEVVDLFADNATLEMARDGVYTGKDRIRAYFYALGNGQQGLREGQLNEHLQLMPVVTLSDDGLSAKARWRDIMMVGELGTQAFWGEGPFENEYIKDNGVWKISKLWWQQAILVAYDGGWPKNKDANNGIWVSDTLPADAPPTQDHGVWPQTWLPPFSFANPVGKYVPDAADNADAPATAALPAVGAQR